MICKVMFRVGYLLYFLAVSGGKWTGSDPRSFYFLNKMSLTFFDPTSNLVRQYDSPVLLRFRKMSDTIFVAFVRLLSESVRRFSSCSTDFSQQIAQVLLFLFFHVFLF
jgi:hypothetical protein